MRRFTLLYMLSVVAVDGFTTHYRATGDHGQRLNHGTSLLALDDVDNEDSSTSFMSRRKALAAAATGGIALATTTSRIAPAQAAVGSLPEFENTNVILQGLTIRVADAGQRDQMITFLEDAFDMVLLRGTQEDAWLGYGPEQLSTPESFKIPVSSFGTYGGHASIRLRYEAEAKSAYYRGGTDVADDDTNIAYLQVGVPQYRVSQMVKNGANVLDAYGYVSVISPAGLPMRGIVGIWPDPIMFVALHCGNVQESAAFYRQLGFSEQEYPYCRPLKGMGQFEPPQPKNSIYMAPSPNCMGVLLLPSKKKKTKTNPAVESLNLVYNPDGTNSSDEDESLSGATDPNGVGISFQSASAFTSMEKVTRIPR